MQNAKPLELFQALPDLLKLAQQEAADGTDVYAVQDQLLAIWSADRLSCRTAMPFRHQVQCQFCGCTLPAIQYKAHLFTAAEEARCFEISESEIHAIREHGAGFPTEFTAALAPGAGLLRQGDLL